MTFSQPEYQENHPQKLAKNQDLKSLRSLNSFVIMSRN
jgi:hypothetical protein